MKNGDVIKSEYVISSIGSLQTEKILSQPTILRTKYPQARGHIYGFFGIEGKIEIPEGNHWFWPFDDKHDFDFKKLDDEYKKGILKEKLNEINLD